MPTIAQKLCNEIVEPILAPSSNEITKTIPFRKSFKSMSGNSTIRFANPTKSIIIEKKKTISQIEPTSKTVINKIKSKETVFKQDLTDTGVNTFISGPLRCDNNCVTNVRRREHHCTCKYGLKKNNFKTSSKQVQTMLRSCSRSDKACSHCINTNNCGTQFIENLNSKLRTQISNRLLLKKSNEFSPQYSYRNTSNVPSRISKTLCQNAKRWALSNYHSRGPDF